MQSKSCGCILFGGIEPRQLTPPTFMFFVLKKNLLFPKSKKRQTEGTLKLIFKQSWLEVHPPPADLTASISKLPV